MGLLDFLLGPPHEDEKHSAAPRMIMEAEHWELRDVDFYRVFEALPELAPVDALLVLAECSPSSELQAFYEQHSREPEEAVLKALRPEFRQGVFLPVTPALMSTLTTLADHHASPEVAIHLAVADAHRVILEWFDAGLPGDPVSVAPFIDEEAIRRFASRTGATYERRPFVIG